MNHRMICRQLLLAVSVCILALLLAGCARDNGQSGEKDDKAMRLTKEYALEHAALEESDLEGIDFEAFVDYYELTTADLEQYDLKALLKMYRDELALGERTDFTEIYEKAEGTLTETDLDQISQLIWELHDSNYNSCMVLDLDNRAVYYGEGFFLDDCGDEHRVGELSDEDVAFIRQALLDSGICTWNSEYTGTSEGTTGHFAWAIGARLADGRCVSYSGSGVLNSGTPVEMNALLNALVERFGAK